jgi:hypothetical protein
MGRGWAGPAERAFVGRAHELARIDAVLEESARRSLVLVHGPSGIGKSRLLQRVEQRCAELGRAVALLDAAALANSEGAALALVAWAGEHPAPVVVIDGWDEAGGGARAIRDDLLARLPAAAVVVIAGRAAPDPDWWEGWRELILELPLAPLDLGDALELLSLTGVADRDRAARLASWAGGSPLALVMAAGAGEGFRPDRPDRLDSLDRLDQASNATLVARLSRRLLDGDVPDERLGPLAVAATARVTTPDVLAAALPGVDAEETYGWLSGRSYADLTPGGLALHSLVAGVVRSEIGQRHPDLVRDVRRRLADHLWARAVRAGTPFVPDLMHLIHDPDVRWGIGWDDRIEYAIDRVRPGDEEALAPFWPQPTDADPWAWIVRYLREAPEAAGVARNKNGAVAGLMISVTVQSAPALCAEDPVLGPWLEYARSNDPTDNGVLWRTSNDFSGDPRWPVQALLGAAGIRRSGLPNPRYVYLPINPKAELAVAFSAAIGAVRVEGLDATLGPETHECHVADMGPGGILGAYRDVVYAELGLVPPTPEPFPAEAVRDALRHWDDPVVLAGSPLAEGTTMGERSDSVRATLNGALDRAFGVGAEDALLRRVLEHGYLAHVSSHEATARRLGLSPDAYFRRLREATERVAACLPG